jgi:hypothetical protein
MSISLPEHRFTQMQRITHSILESRIRKRDQDEDDDGQNLEYAISGVQNISVVTLHTVWKIRMITTHRGIAGIWPVPARPARIFEVSRAISA